MIFICVICMVKRPPLTPLEAEHRTLLEALVSPVVNTDFIKSCHCQLLLCTRCKRLMQTVYNFQQTAVIGVTNLQHMLCELKKERTIINLPLEAVDVKFEPPEPNSDSESPIIPPLEAVDVKSEPPEPDYDSESPVPNESKLKTTKPTTSLSLSKLQFMVNSLNEELDVKFEPEPRGSESESVVEPDPISESAGGGGCGAPGKQPAASAAPTIQQVPLLPNMPSTTEKGAQFEVFTHKPHPSEEGVRGDRPKKKRVQRKPPRRPCPHCDKHIRANYLQMHITIQHGEISPRECDVCGKQQRNEVALRAHIKDRHRREKKMRSELFCSECCIQFSCPSAYKMHLTTLKHTPREQYEFGCDKCGMKFLDKKRLAHHIEVVHLHQKKHKCEKCDMAFGTPSQVRRHVAEVHEKRRKHHICDQCGKKFTNRKSLAEHLLSHEGLRPHQCPLCPANFTYKAALYTHNKLKHLKIKGNWKKKKKAAKEIEGNVEEEEGNSEEMMGNSEEIVGSVEEKAAGSNNGVL